MDRIESPLIYCYWGKADGDAYHLLVHHALDVAAVGLVWWDSSPAIRRAFLQAFLVDESQTRQLRAWLLFFLALHDLGKLDVRFQLKAPAILQTLWPQFDVANSNQSEREILDYAHGPHGFDWAFQCEECFDWFGEIENAEELMERWTPWLAAVTGHHGDIASTTADFLPPKNKPAAKQDRQARQELVNALTALFLHPEGLSLTALLPTCDTAAQHVLAGFCSVCDWIGSNIEIMPYVAADPTIALADYLAERASQFSNGRWLQHLGLIGSTQPYQGLTALLQAGETPHSIQRLVDAWPTASSLTLIEAPTGSGKTEAALAHAWRLLASGTADSVIFALPTQATANAMLKRVEDFAQKAFCSKGTNLVLAHGKSRFHSEFQALLARARQPSAQGSQEATQQCAQWLAQSRKRVFLGQLGICTVDQVLLSVLPVRHQFVRGFGIHKSVLIVDEVHAYDRYMHGLLQEVLTRQKATGGSAVLLSATLPSGLRNRLLDAWAASGPTEAPYPAVWCATGGPVIPATVADEAGLFTRSVALELLKLPGAFPDEALLARLIAAAETGALVGVVVNLVDDAQRLARRLRELTNRPVDLFHARYRFADRETKEKLVFQHYGRESERSSGRILVATQVVEQSLDLDFDWLLTQICPVDLLFQRLGRLHRHQRPHRPAGFETARCTVISVEGEDYGAHKFIYGNIRVLWRTERLLTQTKTLEFPAAYRDWIEPVYQQEDWDDEPEAIRLDYDKFHIEGNAAEADAQQMISTPRKLYGDDEASIAVHTRDGEMSLTILPVIADGSLLDGSNLNVMEDGPRAEALNLNAISVPHTWRKSTLLNCPTDDEGRYRLTFVADGADKWASHLESATLYYSKEFGLERKSDNLASERT